MHSWHPNPNPERDQTILSYIINLKTLDVVWVEGWYEDIKAIAGREVDFGEVDWSNFNIVCFDETFGSRCN